ncbi:hypothetical protein [Pedomonas mirosovicensis]|uniref:hypothetical protein n=1 Tax=Pedomonas mirosovicensis TaxID=2908641 RepID=UPI002167BDAD|nr:hypothetical protein [Pedomonas mirosovicensis]MCH8685426.1 hypothetical protein [Pedomonas mirosovicensis]
MKALTNLRRLAGIRLAGEGRSWRVAGLVAVMMPALLAGCANNPLEVTRTLCPATAVPKYAGTLTFFSPPSSRTADSVVANASIFGLENHCVESSPKVTSNLRFTIGAQRPNAAAAQTITVPYFVAVVKEGKEIVSKQVYEATLTFQPGDVRAESVQTVQAAIDREEALKLIGPDPSKKKRKRGEPRQPEDLFFDAKPKDSGFEVLVGFQLTDEQAHYNIAH